MADGTFGLAEEELLAADFRLRTPFRGRAGQTDSSFGAGGKSNIFCIWAMWETWTRSRIVKPFFMAWMGSPLKYAVRCRTP